MAHALTAFVLAFARCDRNLFALLFRAGYRMPGLCPGALAHTQNRYHYESSLCTHAGYSYEVRYTALQCHHLPPDNRFNMFAIVKEWNIFHME